MSNTNELPGLVEEILKVNAVKEGTKVVHVSPHIYDERITDAFRIALNNMGAEFIRLVLPPKSTPDHKVGNPLTSYAVEILKTAELVVSTSNYTWWGHTSAPRPTGRIYLYSEEFTEVMSAGVRWLDVMIPEEGMRRLFPSEDLIERTWAGARRMAKASELRITSPAGTDLTLRKDGRKGHRQCGQANEKGMWDNLGFGLVATAPLEDSAEGKLVLAPNDYMLQLGMEVKDKVEMTIKGGRIVSIEGGLTSTILNQWFNQWDNDETFIPAHIGWGTHHNGVWFGTAGFNLADSESYRGNMQIAFGKNIFNTIHPNVGLGGKNTTTEGHIDLDCLNHSFYLDGEQIVNEGKIVDPELK